MASICAALAVLCGCSSIGPGTVQRDQVEYAAALSTAAKRQMLLNIVRLRYGDAPSFVTVNQLVAGYTLEGRVGAGSDINNDSFELGDAIDLSVGGTFSDRPTVTYTPVRGADLARLLFRAIPPSSLFAVIVAGAPPNVVLGLGVHSIQGMNNLTSTGSGFLAGSPGFIETVGLLQGLAADGRLRLRFETRAEDSRLYLDPGPDLEYDDPRYERLIELLGLRQGQDRYPIVFGEGRGDGTQIAIKTRSLGEILRNLSARIAVPDGDVASGETYESPDSAGPDVINLQVRHQLLGFGGAYVAVK